MLWLFQYLILIVRSQISSIYNKPTTKKIDAMTLSRKSSTIIFLLFKNGTNGARIQFPRNLAFNIVQFKSTANLEY